MRTTSRAENFVALFLSLLAPIGITQTVWAVSPTPEELSESNRWVAAKALDVGFERNGEGEFVLHHGKGALAKPTDYEPLETELPHQQFAASSSHAFEEMQNANEANQKMFIDRYLAEGLKIDYWWMDADGTRLRKAGGIQEPGNRTPSVFPTGCALFRITRIPRP